MLKENQKVELQRANEGQRERWLDDLRRRLGEVENTKLKCI